MAFEYPSTITARKKKAKNKKKTEAEKAEQVFMEKVSKTMKPIFDKPDSFKKDLAIVQLDDALSRTEGSEKVFKDQSKLKKVVDAAADDKQLERSERRMMRNMSKGGRAGYKDGSKGCGKANKGKGRAYGQNS